MDMPTYLTGQLLLALPGIGDPRFEHAVIAMCAHDDAGALGIGIGAVAHGIGFHELLRQFDIDPGEAPDCPIHLGGPVEPQRGWILTSRPPDDVEYRGVGAGLYLSASPVFLRRVLTTRPFPKRTHVLAGYAGWGPGQLDAELAESAWLIMPVELDLIFEIPAAAAWEMAIRRLGADPHLLQMGHGVH